MRKYLSKFNRSFYQANCQAMSAYLWHFIILKNVALKFIMPVRKCFPKMRKEWVKLVHHRG